MMTTSPARFRRLSLAEWVWIGGCAAFGLGLWVASRWLVGGIAPIAAGENGLEWLFLPEVWGALLVGLAGLVVGAAAAGWAFGVAAAVMVTSLAAMRERTRKIAMFASPPVGAMCAVLWLLMSPG